ncbi:MAG: sortase [Propionicimonas sp.]|uniref:sortase n=1 Tax=Propionicimonas sp. TaxID=1955623 RepID=UPI0025D612CC|nr:sortase [Propionicimonas sp.]MCG2805445.1 sortase [Propionicimonas sp.]
MIETTSTVAEISADATAAPPPAQAATSGERPSARRSAGTRPPRPPRRRPKPNRLREPLSPRELVIKGAMSMTAVVLLGFVATLAVLGPLQHVISQQQLRGQYGEQLAAGMAPVSEGNFDNVLLTDGEPVARIEIPALGVDEIVAEGTSSAVLAKGPGHRRDTALPGQAGVTVLTGRATAYGGPFGRLQELPPGETISIITGQGEHIYRVIGVRYAGDPTPAAITAAKSRLVLVTARGGPFMPSGLVWVDAELVSAVQPNGARLTTYATLAAKDRELAIDPSTAWALVFALQFLLVAEAAAVYARRHFGGRKTWIVMMPVLLLSGLLVADQVTRLLPNLM